MKKDRSVSLEHEEYEDNQAAVVKDAIKAVIETECGYYVNLVTPSGLGHPEAYLTEPLQRLFQDMIQIKYIDQCGCGGYVLRVWKNN